MKSEIKSIRAKERWAKPEYRKKMVLAHKGKFIKHGLSTRHFKSRFYKTWENINTRCKSKSYKSYKNYGGKGIRVEWKEFMNFYTDMYAEWVEHVKKYGEKNTTIDRINSNGNYCHDNCRWATWKEQGENRKNHEK